MPAIQLRSGYLPDMCTTNCYVLVYKKGSSTGYIVTNERMLIRSFWYRVSLTPGKDKKEEFLSTFAFTYFYKIVFHFRDLWSRIIV